VLGVGSALENVVPPIPADTFVLLGGFLSARAILTPVLVFLVTWGANVASALAMYWVGATHGEAFFERGRGRHLLNPHQRERMGRFYARFGIAAVFFTRFLPGLRSVVPPTAGLARLGWWKVLPPLALASAIWYGALVWLGFTAGNHLDRIEDSIDRANLVLVLIAVVIFGGIGVWWWRTRRAR
jgi:membrane protein DedA with SNARE-associated domain